MSIDIDLIAPCGMNCALCGAYQFKQLDFNQYGYHRSYCPGCIPRGENCSFLGGLCEKLAKGTIRFCYECPDFPCPRLKRLDKRYRTKYGLSQIANLRMMKEQGPEAFLKSEEDKWPCPQCGQLICCHWKMCLECNKEALDKKHKRETK